MNDSSSKLQHSVLELEVKMAFLEDALIKLSDEHYQQQKELDALKMKYAQMSDKLKSGFDKDDNPGSVEDERPPHY